MSQLTDLLAKMVRTARKEKHLSQEALAERVGVCKRTIIDIENSTGNPKFEVLYALVHELNLPVYQIFYPGSVQSHELKDVLMEELNRCSEQELKIMLTVLRGLRSAMQEDQI